MHKYITHPAKWVLKNKLRSLLGKKACLDKKWYDVGQDPRQGDLRAPEHQNDPTNYGTDDRQA